MSNKIKNGLGITVMSALATVMATMPIYASNNDDKHFTGKDEGIVAPVPPKFEEPKDEPEIPKIPYFVIFLDNDGSYLKSEVVMAGENATPPVIDNDAFTGWSEDFTNINSNKTIIAQYKKFYGKDEGITPPIPPKLEDFGEEPVIPTIPVAPKEPTSNNKVIMNTDSSLDFLGNDSDDDKHFTGKDEGVTPPTSEVPEVPDDPIEPTIPEIPTEPEKPTTPVTPNVPEVIEPEEPNDSENENDDDQNFVGKDEGVTPPTPEVPDETPTDPVEPTIPETPTGPEKPVKPETPVTPEEPVVPENPNNADNQSDASITKTEGKKQYTEPIKSDDIIPTGLNDELREHSFRYFLILAPILIVLSTLVIKFKNKNSAKENK